MKMKTLAVSVLFSALVIVHNNANANDAAVSIIKGMSFEGLSLKSTDAEIESYLSKYPSLQCRRTDVPQRESKIKKKIIQSAKSWHCMSSARAEPMIVNIKKRGGAITHMDIQVEYPDAKGYEKVHAYFKSESEKFKATGLVGPHVDKQNNMSFQDSDHPGASSPTFTQVLKVKLLSKCQNKPVHYNLTTSAMKMSGVHRASFKMQRDDAAMYCD